MCERARRAVHKAPTVVPAELNLTERLAASGYGMPTQETASAVPETREDGENWDLMAEMIASVFTVKE